MAPFLRIAFNSYDLGILPPLPDPPFCAIKMKEALTTGTTSSLEVTTTIEGKENSTAFSDFKVSLTSEFFSPFVYLSFLRTRQDPGSEKTHHVPCLEGQFWCTHLWGSCDWGPADEDGGGAAGRGHGRSVCARRALQEGQRTCRVLGRMQISDCPNNDDNNTLNLQDKDKTVVDWLWRN